MRKITEIIFASGLALAVLISNIGSFMRDGRDLDRLRGKVLRLHILANSDSEEDQRLKLTVRDELLKSGILDGAEDLGEAIAQEKLPEIVELAEETLRENGCDSNVTAELADVEFDKRVYGDITMPAGTYRALRIKIGAAQGHNWWCVMYPAMCIPLASQPADTLNTLPEDFTGNRVEFRFAVYEFFKSLFTGELSCAPGASAKTPPPDVSCCG